MRYSVFWFPNSPCFFTDNDTLHALSPPPPLPSFTTGTFRPECHQVSSYSLPCCTRNDTSNVPLDAVYFPLRPTSATLSATRHVRAVIPAPHSTSEPPSLLAPTPPRTPLHFHPILPTHSDTTQSDTRLLVPLTHTKELACLDASTACLRLPLPLRTLAAAAGA